MFPLGFYPPLEPGGVKTSTKDANRCSPWVSTHPESQVA